MNEELAKYLQSEYQIWLSQVKDEKILPLSIRILLYLIVYPIVISLRILWSFLCLPVVHLITKICMYPMIDIRSGGWKDTIKRDLMNYKLNFQRSLLDIVELLFEWISNIKSAFRPYSYKSYITTVTVMHYIVPTKDMHDRIIGLIDGLAEDRVDYEKVRLCEDDLFALMKEMLAMIIKPRIFIKDGFVHVGR